jgi:hypothetical protein
MRLRMLLAGGLLLTLLPAIGASSHHSYAATGIGTAQTDFAQVTPADATLFAAVQATASDQQANLSALATAISSQPGVQALIQAASGGSAQTPALLKLVMSGLSTVFDGELGLAVLPTTTVTDTHGVAVPRLHLLLDAGLQSGVTFTQLGGLLHLLGLTSASSTTYRNVPISSLSLAPVLGMFKTGRAQPMLSQDSPISSTVYLAAVGNDLVTATDLPSMQAGIDASAGAAPSLAADSGYQSTFGALPDTRVATVYLHADLGALAQLRTALQPGRATGATTTPTGTWSQAFAVTAKSNGLLLTASPALRTGALTTTVTLSPLQNVSANDLPATALFYAALDDPGTLLSSHLAELTTLAQQTGFPLKGLDEVKVLNKLLGLDLDQDVFSLMHGEASVALLPVGSSAFASTVPESTRLSLVLGLKVADQATVDQTLQQLAAAIQGLSADPSGWQLVQTTSTNGSPQRILAATPNGIGYTFANGSLIVGTALPADLAAILGTSSTSNLSSDPQYQAALAAVGSGPYGALAYLNLTALRQSAEQIAQDKGLDLTRYNQMIKPLLQAFKSLTLVANPGTDGGGMAFLGIGN